MISKLIGFTHYIVSLSRDESVLLLTSKIHLSIGFQSTSF